MPKSAVECALIKRTARMIASSCPSPAFVRDILVGADGARSTIARLFNLGRNARFLLGLEREYPDLPAVDANYLHCFLDTRLAHGYLAWLAPAPGFMQVGLATSGGAKPDLQGFLDHTERLFGYSRANVSERRSGLIPCGGPVSPAGAPNVMLIGDAAGHVSPMTGGGIRLAFRYGRRAGQLIHDHLTRGGPRPDLALAGELPSFTLKLAMRKAMDLGPPNWLFDAIIATPAMRWVARRIYFHRRAQPGFEAPPALSRRIGFDRQRMNPAGEIVCQDTVNHAVARHTPLPGKLRCDDSHPEMAFARRMRPGMAFMQMRFVDDLKLVRPQFCH